MNKLQAAMKDSSAKKHAVEVHYYKVGSYFKGCNHCGEKVEVEVGNSGRTVTKFLSGYDVYRSYDPSWTGWTWWCYTCGAKDLVAWAPDTTGLVEAELGKPPIMGTRDVKSNKKYVLRKQLTKFNGKAEPTLKVPSRASEIAELQAKIAELQAKLSK